MNFSRRQLYDLVWSKPILTLAKEYGFSDVGFAKVCRRHNIPLPPRGYWAKVNAGLQVSKPPLPNLYREVSVYIPPRTSITDDEIFRKKKVRAQEKSEVLKMGFISVPDHMISPHKVTHNTQQFFKNIIKKIDQVTKSNSLPDDYYSTISSIYRGRLRCKSANCFHLTVSEKNIERALVFLDVLVKEFEKIGFKIHSDKANGPVVATKDNEEISFLVSEGYKYQVVEDSNKMTPLERLLYPEKMPIATGKLTFSMYAAETNLGRSWTDGKRVIEQELPAIIHEFNNLVLRQKQARIDELARKELRNEEARLFRERESYRCFEQSIYEEALQEAQLFRVHQDLDAYLNYLEVQYTEKYGSTSEQVQSWFSTARKIANEKNPVSRRLKIWASNLDN